VLVAGAKAKKGNAIIATGINHLLALKSLRVRELAIGLAP
jgi:hypothetical protein